MPRLVSSGNLWNDRMAAGIQQPELSDRRWPAGRQGLPEGRSLDGNYKLWWKACQRDGEGMPMQRRKLLHSAYNLLLSASSN